MLRGVKEERADYTSNGCAKLNAYVSSLNVILRRENRVTWTEGL